MNLSHAEKVLIIAALQAIAPSGGGSKQFHLANELAHLWNIEIAPEYVGELQMTIYEEVKDCLND